MKPELRLYTGLMALLLLCLTQLLPPSGAMAAGMLQPATPGVQTSAAPAKTNTRKAEKKRLRQAWKEAKALLAATGRQLYREDMADRKRYNISLLACIFGGGSFLMLFIFPPLGFAMAIAGLIMGIIGLGQYRDAPADKSSGKTLALLGLILGGTSIFLSLIAVFVALALWGA